MCEESRVGANGSLQARFDDRRNGFSRVMRRPEIPRRGGLFRGGILDTAASRVLFPSWATGDGARPLCCSHGVFLTEARAGMPQRQGCLNEERDPAGRGPSVGRGCRSPWSGFSFG